MSPEQSRVTAVTLPHRIFRIDDSDDEEIARWYEGCPAFSRGTMRRDRPSK